MNWLTGRKYQVLLLAFLGLVVVFPVLRSGTDTRLLLDFLLSLLFLAAILLVFPDRRRRAAGALLAFPTILGLWTGYLIPGVPRAPLAAGFHVLAALFLCFTVAVILRSVHTEEGVSADSVYGAFCGYLLIGMVFGHLYCLADVFAPGSLKGEDLASEMPEGRRHFLLTYFSFVTLTTVGYGDITPNSDAVRGLAMVEAIVGQFYIAVLVAELIGKRVGTAVEKRDADAPPGVPPPPPG